MLKNGQVSWSAQGKKECKIQRLRLNDKLERDTGSSVEVGLYGRLSALEFIMREREAAGKSVVSDYSKLNPAQICGVLERRKLSCTGSTSTLIERLQKDDRTTIEKNVSLIKVRHDQLKAELESKTGRPTIAEDVLNREKTQNGIEQELLRAVERPIPVPICDYNWKDSHWAERTERQLREICSRRGMPGHGPKAAMLKWLDTGNVEYEDMYIDGLQSISRDRGVTYKESDKKVDLIKRLQEADEAE